MILIVVEAVTKDFCCYQLLSCHVFHSKSAEVRYRSGPGLLTTLALSREPRESYVARKCRPTRAAHRSSLRGRSSHPPQTLIDAFVEQDFHLTSVSTLTFAVSSTATTCSRVTVGKPSKKSSIVSPASRYSKRVCTGTRVPANTGVPPIISGEIVIKLLLIYESLLV